MNQDSKQQKSLFGQWLDDNDDLIQFVGIAAAVFAVLQLIYYQFYLDSNLFHSYLVFCARMSSEVLLLIGEPVSVSFRVLMSPSGPKLIVVEGCDALRIFSVLVAVIIAFDTRWSAKAWGLMLGLSIMFVLNIFRISGLLWVDVHHTDLFDLFHHTIFPLALWAAAVTYFFLWGKFVTQ
jgi:exosortase/archaeosortase family protein